MNYKEFIREVPNFPKQGILFYDITTLLNNKTAFQALIDEMSLKAKNFGVTKIAAVESRGFIFGAPLAYKLGLPFVPIRKPKKLPYKTVKMEYFLEYGKDSIEMHEDAVTNTDRVLLVDDLLATGGTIEACTKLIELKKATVAGMMFAIELDFLNGKSRLNKYQIESIIHY